jgi:nucleoside-diphosphate-sugar epimerase
VKRPRSRPRRKNEPRPSTVLIAGATGSIGRYAVAEALQQGYAVRALVRDQNRAARILPDGVDLVIGDLTRPGRVRRSWRVGSPPRDLPLEPSCWACRNPP